MAGKRPHTVKTLGYVTEDSTRGHVSPRKPKPGSKRAEATAIPDEEFDSMLDRAEKRWAGLLERLAK